jgi:hypothetical protein
MPRIGEVNLAQIVAEVGPILERVDTVEQAIAECGAARSPEHPARPGRWVPLGRQPASTNRAARLRRQLPARLTLGRQAVCRRRPARQAPPHAIRILARAWLRVIWACWQTDTAYDPAKHRGEQRLAA